MTFLIFEINSRKFLNWLKILKYIMLMNHFYITFHFADFYIKCFSLYILNIFFKPFIQFIS